MDIEKSIVPANQMNKLEMDEINQHKCMIPLLEVIDFMEAKFPSEQMP